MTSWRTWTLMLAVAAWVTGCHGHDHAHEPAAPVHDHARAHPHDDPGGACTCDAAKLSNGWCGACGVGFVAGTEVRSADLHEALDAHGHDYIVSTIRCGQCREAEAVDGLCSRHERGFTGGMLYASRLTWALAQGTPTAPGEIGCARCRGGADAWCEACERGVVGNVVFTDEAFYEIARDEHRRLRAAIAEQERCEMCGVAMFLRSGCPECGTSHRQ